MEHRSNCPLSPAFDTGTCPHYWQDDRMTEGTCGPEKYAGKCREVRMLSECIWKECACPGVECPECGANRTTLWDMFGEPDESPNYTLCRVMLRNCKLCDRAISQQSFELVDGLAAKAGVRW